MNASSLVKTKSFAEFKFVKRKNYWKYDGSPKKKKLSPTAKNR
jgi:hypothetical protein